MKKIVLLLALVFTFISYSVEAQRYVRNTEVQISLGLNTIANNGSQSPVENIDEWAFSSIPVTIGLVYKWNALFGITHSYSFNKFDDSKLDGRPISEDFNYFAVDTGVNYYFGEHFLNSDSVDLFASAGLGVFKIDDVNGSFNFGGGLTYWINDTIGVSGEGIAKLAFEHADKVYDTNHLQFNLKVVYRL